MLTWTTQNQSAVLPFRARGRSLCDWFPGIPISRDKAWTRLLHSPSLVAIGLSKEYETWFPILAGITLLWLVGLNIDWDCLVPQCIIGVCDQWEFPLFFRPQWQSLGTALTAGAVQGDCEIVKAWCHISEEKPTRGSCDWYWARVATTQAEDYVIVKAVTRRMWCGLVLLGGGILQGSTQITPQGKP